MKNRKARLLIATSGQRIRVTNRLVVRYAPSDLARGLPTHFYGIGRRRSAAQNRWKNHALKEVR